MLLAAFFAAIASSVIAYVVFDVRGLFDPWQCGTSDCDTTGLGAVTVAIAFAIAGAVLGGFFTAWRAETLGEVALRYVVWLILTMAAAIVVAISWQLPPGHPAA